MGGRISLICFFRRPQKSAACLLSSITNIANYSYNCDGVRCKKERPGGNITTYYLDGAKILGEDRKDSNGNTVRLRYFYDIDGLCGISYNDTYYKCARNAYGDIMLITIGSSIVARYEYDAWGNYKVFDYQGNEDNDANSIGNINPFRWKGHYYDVESGLYYANGSYYDPEVGLHVDAMPVSSLIENAFKVFGLDLNGLMCDNILAYLPCVYSIFTTLELSPDPLYDKDANKPWWELAWNAIVNWLAGVAKWFSEIDIGIKIGVGLLVFAAACALVIMSAPTGGTTLAGAIAAYTGMSNTIAAATVAGMTITYAVGIASAAAMGAVSALLSGGDVVEAMTNAVADAIFWGGVFAFISAGINALKTVARTTYNAKLPGSSQTGAQPQSTVNQCFKEGTLVETEEGLKPIEEIAVGDKVLAFDETTGEQAYKPVVQLFRNTTKEWQYVYIEGETQPIISTPGHKYYLPENNTCREETRPYEHAAYAELSEKWVSACDLKPGDKVLLFNGKYGKVLKSVCVQLDVPETTYNMEVADFHTYYVGENPVCVHNNNCSTTDLYRGGNKMNVRGRDVEIIDDLVQPTRGISVNSNPNAVMNFGGAYKIGKLPNGLKIKYTGGTHYEIIPKYAMSLEKYQLLLNQIPLTPLLG